MNKFISVLTQSTAAISTGRAKVVAILSCLGLMFFLYGCNTMEGVGEDVEAAGDKIEKSAKETKNY